jgi:hypothetical protein
MEQSKSVFASWRRAAWQHRGLQHITTTSAPNSYRLGSELQQNRQRYRITHYHVAPDRRRFEVWGQPIDAAAPRPPARVTLNLFLGYEPCSR